MGERIPALGAIRANLTYAFRDCVAFRDELFERGLFLFALQPTPSENAIERKGEALSRGQQSGHAHSGQPVFPDSCEAFARALARNRMISDAGFDAGVEARIRAGGVGAEIDQVFGLAIERQSFADFAGMLRFCSGVASCDCRRLTESSTWMAG